MAKFLRTTILSTTILAAMILTVGCAIGAAQAAVPATSAATSPSKSDDAGQPAVPLTADSPRSELTPGELTSGKVGLVRGVLKRLDPIHDQLLIRAFGGGDVRIAFDPRTQLLAENTTTHLVSLPPGSIVSVDTVIDNGKLFARSVRTGGSSAVELNGQVVRYDATRSQLTLHDPLSPKSVVLRVTPSTVVVDQGKAAAPQDLSAGMLVQVWFSPTQSMGNSVNRVEILAARGNSFAFQGRVVAVDLRARVLALSNDSDQSVRELSIGSLDADNLHLLHEGAEVSIQAEFDGEHYNVRTVTAIPGNNP